MRASGGGFDSPLALWQCAPHFAGPPSETSISEQDNERPMIKPEWGTKRTCPKCATRFYDLDKDDPVTCIDCGYAWEPEADPEVEAAAAVRSRPSPTPRRTTTWKATTRSWSMPTRTRASADDDVDLGGDDDLGVETGGNDDEQLIWIGDGGSARSAPDRRLPSPAPPGLRARLPDGCGAVAQLGERLHGIAEVRGSIPLGSTIAPRRDGFSRANSTSRKRGRAAHSAV